MNTETVKTTPIQLTDTAYQQLLKISREQSVPEDYGLRTGVRGGGCSGFSYMLGFDVQSEKDQVYHFRDMPIYMEKAHEHTSLVWK